MKDSVAYNMTFWGITLSFTFESVIAVAGVMIGVAGVIMQLLNWREKRRENDLKEKEHRLKEKELCLSKKQ